MLETHVQFITPSQRTTQALADCSKQMFYKYLEFVISKVESEEQHAPLLKYLTKALENKELINWRYCTSLSYCDVHSKADFSLELLLLQLCLYLASLGVEGDFSIKLSKPTLLYFDCYPVFFKESVSVNVQGHTASFYGDGRTDRRTYSLTESKVWNLNTDPYPSINKQVIQTNDFIDLNFIEEGVCGKGNVDIALQDIKVAKNLIKKSSQRLHEWVDDILNSIVLIQMEDNLVTSGSSTSHNGIIYLTYPTKVSHIACLIVHECSHLYFYLITRDLVIVDPNSDELIFSPFKRVDRPPLYVMLALHAAINIYLFTSNYIAKYHDNFLANENNELIAQIDQMITCLMQSSSLTVNGRTLLMKLIEAYNENRRHLQERGDNKQA